MAQKSITERIGEQPVQLTTLVLGILLFLNVQVFGDGAPAYVSIISLIAPVIAGFIASRFTFSQQFVTWAVSYLTAAINTSDETRRERNVRRQDARLVRGTNDPLPRERGLTTLGLLIVIFIVLVIFLLVVPGIGVRGR